MIKVVITVVVLLLIGGGIYLASQTSKPQEKVMKDTSTKDKAMMEKEASGSMEKKDGETMMKKEEGAMMAKYTGTVLAGKSAPLLDYNKADYDAAIASDKLVVLYFYANWCPICKVEVPNALYPAFNELTTEKVIGIRINYKDSDTDKDEENLARQYGITYQHTKVFVKNGKQILKAPDTWDKTRYITEINKALTQQK